MIRLALRLLRRVRVCRSPAGLPPGTIVLFPVSRTRLPCGLAGLVEVVAEDAPAGPDPAPATAAVRALGDHGLAAHPDGGDEYAGGTESIATLEDLVRDLRRPDAFPFLFGDADLRARLAGLAAGIEEFVDDEGRRLDAGEGLPTLAAQEAVNGRLTRLRDAAWAVGKEVLPNVDRVAGLLGDRVASPKALRELRKANLILNAIDRLEIRGRDSAGILFQVSFPDGAALGERLARHEAAAGRLDLPDFPDGAVSRSADGRTLTLVYKVAAEVGKLGENVAALRRSVAGDDLLHDLIAAGDSRTLVLAHTRWASNGIINVPNCHPLDNACAGTAVPGIHVALNGDIDNYLDLKRRYEKETGLRIPERITTDAKIIALWVDRHLRDGASLEEAFLRAVREFEGSAAILMTSDAEPGRLYLSLKGSGQSLYVGLPPNGYVVASEIYGLVEETDRFVKLEGAQVFVLDPGAAGPGGIRAFRHDGVRVAIGEDDVQTAEITTRDVDRGDFEHYFVKEVSQAADSVRKTLRGKFTRDGRPRMGEETIPAELGRLLESRELQRIAVIGQGTASVAAMAIAAFLADHLHGAGVVVEAPKATELSGFGLEPDMSRTLVVAVTQSGATADTNRAVDLARDHGAVTLAIVNRRNSDVTFKTAGVLYTSDGRDVEMSVASTKAFYSQVVAGALLALALGHRAGTLTEARVARELAELRELPRLLSRVFSMSDRIAASAAALAPTRRYWAVVGSGPNRIAAEEVRIKLSELCYKSISADSVEDKKHIDLSAEPLMLVLAAGTSEFVLQDLAKDVAIFKAHRALPVVFVTEGERRFDEYARAVIELPAASPLLSIILATMGGHLFGYHAARAINDGARFLGRIRSVVVGMIERPTSGALNDLRRLSREFRGWLRRDRFTSALEADTAVDLTMLLKYAGGEIPPIGFEEEFERDPGPAEIHGALLESLVAAIDQTRRPVDAIKHQAKIVTVGTSRLEEVPAGAIFDALAKAGVSSSAIAFADRTLLAQAQVAVEEVTGITRYAVEGLESDGQPGPASTIRVTEQSGPGADFASRAANGAPLKGTKRTVVSDRAAFVGIGAKDGRRICIIPLVDHRFAVSSLILLHLEFRSRADLTEKIEILGDRYDDLVDGVAEADVTWTDDLLEPISPEDLLLVPPTGLAERIVRAVGGA